LSVGADDFYFLLSLAQFLQDFGEWPENQILIPDWTYFHCPGATLVPLSPDQKHRVVPAEGEN